MTASGIAGLVGRFVVWWLLLFAVWWAFVGEFSMDELWWGAGLATLAAVTGVLVTAFGLVDGRTVGRSLRVTPSVAWAVLVDFGLVVGVLVARIASGRRGTAGTFVRRQADVPLSGPGIRSWVTIAATFSPNSYVVDLDPYTGEAVLHDLTPHRASERPA